MWSSRPYRDLLDAGLLDLPQAASAWQRLADRGGPETVAGAHHLLPLAEWNLRRLGALPGRERGIGAVERSWLDCEQRCEAAAGLLAGLRLAGVRCLVIKGLALAHLAYPHRALRPMNDVDVLVGDEALPAALTHLERAGWQPVPSRSPELARPRHAVTLRSGRGFELDLHRYALADCCDPGVDDGLWQRAVPLEVAGEQALTLSPADHLLVVAAHGLRWGPEPPAHWVADAVLLLRRLGTLVRWEVLLEESRRRRMGAPAFTALRFLRREYAAPVPDEVVRALARDGRLSPTRLELAARSRPPALLPGLYLHWCDLRRLRPELPAARRAMLFPGYLRHLWSLERVGQVPREALRKSTARIVSRWRRDPRAPR